MPTLPNVCVCEKVDGLKEDKKVGGTCMHSVLEPWNRSVNFSFLSDSESYSIGLIWPAQYFKVAKNGFSHDVISVTCI